jgi:hypothetical protein
VAQRDQARQLGIIWRRFGRALRCRSRRCEEAARGADGVLSRLNARDLVLMERNRLNSPEASMDDPLGSHPLYVAAACVWSQLSRRVTGRRSQSEFRCPALLTCAAHVVVGHLRYCGCAGQATSTARPKLPRSRVSCEFSKIWFVRFRDRSVLSGVVFMRILGADNFRPFNRCPQISDGGRPACREDAIIFDGEV